ncbi:BtrH N-terminal domain-containing protein [Aquipseudomonas alcaligenes]|uniref:Peptidase n=1 Tax=Aquipseudomonas alcaligenes TaxID=43263 RepID=A0AA37FLR4_AQUAC|nr:BtrH N-terminal domain-containing protein [Pseudomonas alcaligenes]BCR22993.1 peptidase [Pseudomonas alcaligenes]GIZ67219.1 peptidase [Pseudomonas alcaligenes]GIZ70894.1 peptidase [Pseudomonas alcaligenes]GIZ75241.1 peptidase [Pseudomonas alcaligenes]GIZ79976.1 peptidase [Pseudomonas alcaligenes]
MSSFEPHFQHRQSAHCESGVMASLLSHAGLPMSEPMAFGLASGLAFAYLPIVKLSGMPLIAYRMPPKHLIKTLSKRLGARLNSRTFGNPEQGRRELDALLDQGRLAGLQSSVFWLPYFPPEMRFHFNAHNLLAYGRDGDEYLISDPVFEEPVRCASADLQKARFAKGALAAKGLMYWLDDVPQEQDWEKLIRQAVLGTTRILDGMPLPWIGIRGIQHLAKQVEQLDPAQTKYNRLYLTHIVRMQEEIGTGGAGFRFMYASFLQEAGEKIGAAELGEASARLTAIGDDWRQFASACVRASRSKGEAPDFRPIAEMLRGIAGQERVLMKELAAWSKRKG